MSQQFDIPHLSDKEEIFTRQLIDAALDNIAREVAFRRGYDTHQSSDKDKRKQVRQLARMVLAEYIQQ